MSDSNCQICCIQASKYTCPKCLLKTCSLACSKSHKNIYNCTGARDKTAFIPKESYSIQNLTSDYHFLEDVARIADNASRSSENMNASTPRKKLPKWAQLALNQEIHIRLMPSGLKRHDENQSRIQSNSIYWTVEFIYKSQTFLLHSIHESCILADILQNPVLNGLDLSRIQCSIKKQDLPANAAEYTILNIHATLKDILKHQIIIEYPTIYIQEI
jgi:hypothetical protein